MKLIKITFFLNLLLGLLVMTISLSAAEEISAADEALRLFNSLGCKGCHQFNGEGGSLAPQLDTIGSRKSREQIRVHLEAQAKTKKTDFMPSYNTTSRRELELLSDFLYSHQP